MPVLLAGALLAGALLAGALLAGALPAGALPAGALLAAALRACSTKRSSLAAFIESPKQQNLVRTCRCVNADVRMMCVVAPERCGGCADRRRHAP